MANRPWAERLKQALVRQALPSYYVERLVEELLDHAADLSLEDASMDAHTIEERLGMPDELAAVARREFQRRTFAGRHPALVFLAGPFLSLMIAFIASFVLLAAGLWFVDMALGGALLANDAIGAAPTAFEIRFMRAVNWVIRLLPFGVSAWLFAALGKRSGRPIWGAIACGLIAATAIAFWSAVDGPGVHGNQGTWTMGFGWRLGTAQVIQAFVPLVGAVWILWPLMKRRAIAFE